MISRESRSLVYVFWGVQESSFLSGSLTKFFFILSLHLSCGFLLISLSFFFLSFVVLFVCAGCYGDGMTKSARRGVWNGQSSSV